ncbi:MAG: response regulator [Gemmatimonadales bacterium]
MTDPSTTRDENRAAGNLLAAFSSIPRGRWTWIVAGYGLVYLVLSPWLPGGLLGTGLDTLTFFPVSFITTLVMYRATRAASAQRFRRGFAMLAISFGLTSLGSLIWGLEGITGHDPTYSWSNIPYLLSFVFAALGIAALPLVKPDRADRIRLALDAAVAVIAGTVIAWLLVITPMLQQDSDPIHGAILLAYPIWDLLLFALMMPLLLTSAATRDGVVPLLATGLGLYLLGDFGYQLSWSGTTLLGFDWSNIPYLSGYTMMVWASEACTISSRALAAAEPVGRARLPSRNPVPLILGGVVVFLLLTTGFASRTLPHQVLAITAVVITVLLLVREGLTERENRTLQRALDARRAEARFASAIERLSIGVVVHTAQGIVTMANKAALDLFGVTEEEVRGRKLVDLPAELRTEDGTVVDAELCPAGAAARTREPVRNVVVSMERPGIRDRRWLLIDAEPEKDEQGAVTQVLVTLHDITARRELEDQLRHVQRMEAVGQLAGGIAHDFNNLLTAIAGYSSSLLDQLSTADPLREEVVEIDRAAMRAADLTQRLLAFGRRQVLHPRVLDVGGVVRGADRLLRRLLREDIDIVLEIAPQSGPVLVDRGQLEQVIINLAVNARDALPRGGRLTIAAGTLDAPPPGMPSAYQFPRFGAVLLEVRDNGSGMDEATRARAFEPFFTTKEVGKGTGLGLATVYGIVRQSGGEVWIRSAPGEGTVVSVLLPRTSTLPTAKADSPAPFSARGSETILVVEDEPSLVTVVRRSLERNGHRVLTANSAARARDIMEVSAVDLLLTDIVMPGGSGPDLARWARGRTPELPVLFMTGYADDAILQSAIDLPHSGLITKPFKPEQLMAKVREVIDRTESIV